jgi:1-deoxy-D-xylulose-5-phosphate synthase
VRTLTLPDRFQDHGSVDALYHDAGLDADGIVASVVSIPGVAAVKARPLKG